MGWHAARAESTTPARPSTTYFIGSAEVPGSTRFDSLDAFSKGVRCIRGGDRIWLEAGREFSGRLKLIECGDFDATGSLVIEIRTVNPQRPIDTTAPERPAVIRPALQAHTAGMAWSVTTAETIPYADPSRHTSVRGYRLAPVVGQVAGLMLGDTLMTPAKYPNGEASPGAPKMLPSSKLLDHGPHCTSSLCIESGDAGLKQILGRLERADRAAWPRLVLRNSPWSFSRHQIADFDAQSGAIRSADNAFGEDHPTGRLPQLGAGFLLSGSTALLDTVNEWAVDPGTQALYLLRGDKAGAPETSTTWLMLEEDQGSDKYAYGDAALAYVGKSDPTKALHHLRISDIQIVGATGSGIRIQEVGHVDISGVSVRAAGEHGISVRNAAGQVAVRSSSVRQTAKNGISINGVGQIVVENNTIEAAGDVRQQSQLGMDFNGIRASGFKKISVAGNSMKATGYAGIMLSEPAGDRPAREALVVDVVDNSISDFCRLLNDCGAIYINGQTPKDVKIALPASRQKVLARNRIDAPWGNMAGLAVQVRPAPESPTTIGDWRRFVGAVYLDHGASGYDIRENEIRGEYPPYGWRVFNRGVGNTCNVDALARCVGPGGGYRCYTGLLESCNQVPPMPAR